MMLLFLCCEANTVTIQPERPRGCADGKAPSNLCGGPQVHNRGRQFQGFLHGGSSVLQAPITSGTLYFLKPHPGTCAFSLDPRAQSIRTEWTVCGGFGCAPQKAQHLLSATRKGRGVG